MDGTARCSEDRKARHQAMPSRRPGTRRPPQAPHFI